MRRHLQDIAEGFVHVIETATPEVLARRLDIAVNAPVTLDSLPNAYTPASE